jgi:L-ascorbate metabolism protein UlaG (beta-lactamase superfamily)
MAGTPKTKITHIGGPTVLIEIGGLRLLTDPTFDAAGEHYKLGLGTASDKLTSPAISVAELGRVDAVLLSHDEHADNLDNAGRKLLPSAGEVVTTASGAKRLGGNALGLAPWAGTDLSAPAAPTVRVTATPARHGPPLSRSLLGDTIGFLLEWEGQVDGALWISGDSVWFGGLAEVGRRSNIGTALLHLGAAKSRITGPIRYTMNAAEGVTATREMGLDRVIPIHYDGWTHFSQGRAEIESAFAEAGLADRLDWLPAGEPREFQI